MRQFIPSPASVDLYIVFSLHIHDVHRLVQSCRTADVQNQCKMPTFTSYTLQARRSHSNHLEFVSITIFTNNRQALAQENASIKDDNLNKAPALKTGCIDAGLGASQCVCDNLCASLNLLRRLCDEPKQTVHGMHGCPLPAACFLLSACC